MKRYYFKKHMAILEKKKNILGFGFTVEEQGGYYFWQLKIGHLSIDIFPKSLV
ncbi:MAG: hypothetical protein IEMM0008_1567 [bacterium]|nr:MAG: hypothetical protein IEMM0008_1567 [bacterium]